MSEEAEPVTRPPGNLASGIVKAIRPRQWPKNVLVLAAPLAALGGNVNYDYRDVLYKVSIAFVVFCLAASSIYLINDARDVEAGYVWVNDVSMHFPGTPYGGIKDSGVGREESLEELLSYTQTKNVNILFDGPAGTERRADRRRHGGMRSP